MNERMNTFQRKPLPVIALLFNVAGRTPNKRRGRMSSAVMGTS